MANTPRKDNTVFIRFGADMVDLSKSLKDMQDNINRLSGDIDLSVSKGNFDKLMKHVEEQLSKVSQQMKLSPEIDTECLQESLNLLTMIQTMLGNVKENFTGVFRKEDVDIAKSLSNALGLSVLQVEDSADKLGKAILSSTDPKLIKKQRQEVQRELNRLEKSYKEAAEGKVKQNKDKKNIY